MEFVDAIRLVRLGGNDVILGGGRLDEKAQSNAF